MGFNVAADAYDRFMGRYSQLLSPQLADLAAVRDGQQVLDVGCGPGALTAELVKRLGPAGVSAVDPIRLIRNGSSSAQPRSQRAAGVRRTAAVPQRRV